MKSDLLLHNSQLDDWFTILDSLYQASGTPNGQLDICLGCNGIPCGECEKSSAPENVTLLPYEDVYIYRRLTDAGINASIQKIKHIETKSSCPFLCNGRCSIHQARPFDCRSYPVFPRFTKKHKINLLVSDICPAIQSVPVNFLSLMNHLWNQVEPSLPEQWKIKYNARNSHGYCRDINASFEITPHIKSRIA